MLDGVRQPFKKVIWPILVGNMAHIGTPLSPPKGGGVAEGGVFALPSIGEGLGVGL